MLFIVIAGILVVHKTTTSMRENVYKAQHARASIEYSSKVSLPSSVTKGFNVQSNTRATIGYV